MDRSFFKKKIILPTLLFVFCCSLLQTSFAEENNNEIEKKVNSLIAIKGKFIGVVKLIDRKQRYFEAISDIPDAGKIFYFDEKTSFKRKWREVKVNELVPNDKVKVVYFKKDQTLLADIVYIEMQLPLK